MCMPTLEEVEAAFREWRASKAKKYERTPENLIAMARGLVSEHGLTNVSQRLGISAQKLSPSTVPVVASGEFVEVPATAMPTAAAPSVITIRVKLSSKKEITVTMPASNVGAVAELVKRISKL